MSTTHLSCAACKLDLAVGFFHPRPDTKRGYRSNCRACEAELCKAAYVRRKASKKATKPKRKAR